ncbi:protein TRACHEARY ELEMENT DIFFERENTIATION-RELATED 7A-like [Andrographis paniculata]|uniref:protein TRACHEARY ELEMENT DIFFERENTIATION-RELATED 7A-like n=1 Tax=Andrographis paniculata TaxID=175694 RepID=UPI0021E71C95|nr:protein TRACHEARY ELEMENT DIFFERENTIATION-RELATED 7A-like [Andrographis paniculata]
MDSLPYFPSPENPTSHHPFPPPPTVSPPPPFHPIHPPSPSPPPPFHPIHPPPSPFHPIPPPPSAPDNGPTVIIVVVVSFGCVLFLALCFFALWCVIKRRKECVEETDVIRTDKHVRVKEEIVEGPCGPEVVVLSVEKDEHTEEEIVRSNKVKVGGKHLHEKPDLETGQSSTPVASEDTFDCKY